MAIPPFDHDLLGPRYQRLRPGEAFARLVNDLLPRDEYPRPHLYPAGGKDGCIDLVCNQGRSIAVFECKDRADFVAVHTAWAEVADKLNRNLAGSDGPPAREPQYRPWYNTDRPVREFTLCVSCHLGNEGQKQALTQEIEVFFDGLVDARPHLQHLRGIAVIVRDWSDCDSWFADKPHVLYGCFPSLQPAGLSILDEQDDTSQFRAYLSQNTLPHYRRSEHLKHDLAPPGVAIPDEHALFEGLSSGKHTGLIIAGGGGIGKTRLTLELGRIAQKRDWTVFLARHSLRPEALDGLADRVTPDTPVLIIIDYVETHQEFDEFIEKLDLLNRDRQLKLRYVASCRTSYYSRVQLVESHQLLDLRPRAGVQAEWEQRYREAATHFILERTGLPPAQYAAMCHDLPVLAVFLAFLHANHRAEELAELLRVADFGLWVLRRVRASFPGSETVDRDLAVALAQFPLSREQAREFTPGQKALLDVLAADRWIEMHDLWEAAHDALVDEVIALHLRSIPATLQEFWREVILQAERLGTLNAAISAAQRLLDLHAGAVPWAALLDERMQANPAAWMQVQNQVLRSSLLTRDQILRLATERREVWGNAWADWGCQRRLGEFAKECVAAPEKVTADERARLVALLQIAASYPSALNYMLNWGLILSPDGLAPCTLEWLISHVESSAAEYVLAGWLRAGRNPDEIAAPVGQWLGLYATQPSACFLYRAWSDAEGDPAVVRAPMLAWLEAHGTERGADFVYKGWLDAKGDPAVVRAPMLAWLEAHGTERGADFVYKGWLDAKGNPALVQAPMLAWLEAHGTEPEAGFVYSAWLDAKGDRAVVQAPMLAWLEAHGTEPEAGFVCEAWLGGGADPQLLHERLLAWLDVHGLEPGAPAMYAAWFKTRGKREPVEIQMLAWLNAHGTELEAAPMYPIWIRAKGDFHSVREQMLAWLDAHGTGLKAAPLYTVWVRAQGDPHSVREQMLAWLEAHGTERGAGFVYKAWLDAKGNPALVQAPMLAWL
ncbi:MAG: hypothetical protein KKI08_05710, partial [Armatimonadetes bacterium]|nr:hypothetical protein [Armatimonadota bacterium]